MRSPSIKLTVPGRGVVLKVLPQAFTNEPDRLPRFERKANSPLLTFIGPHVEPFFGARR